MPYHNKKKEEFLKETIRKKLRYEPNSGILRWKRNNEIAGGISKCGYTRVDITHNEFNGATSSKVFGHRIAWMLYYGEWPELEIDHVNTVKRDNRICNLREATRSQVVSNFIPTNKKSKSETWNKYIGVSTVGRAFIAAVKKDGVSYHLSSLLR